MGVRENIMALLQDLRAGAEAGTVKAVALVVLNADGTVQTYLHGDGSAMKVLGSLDLAKHRAAAAAAPEGG